MRWKHIDQFVWIYSWDGNLPLIYIINQRNVSTLVTTITRCLSNDTKAGTLQASDIDLTLDVQNNLTVETVV